MPPKKRNARANAAEPATPATITTSRGKTIDTTAAAARPKRAPMPTDRLIDEPVGQKPKTALNTKAQETHAASEPKRVGRPPRVKPEQVVAQPKRRGRPARAQPEEVEEEVESDAPPPKKRGRPARAKPEDVEEEIEAEAPLPKKRGRPARAKPEEVEADAPPPKRRGRPARTNPDEVVEEDVTEAPQPPKSGRSTRAKAETSAEPKKRGRPVSAKPEDVTEPPKKRGRPARAEPEEAEIVAEKQPKKKVGRPAKKAKGAKAAAKKVQAEDAAPAEVGSTEELTRRKPGRPSKKRAAEEEPTTISETPPAKRGRPAKGDRQPGKEVVAPTSGQRRRGRPSQAESAVVTAKVATTPKKRGRPSHKKVDEETVAHNPGITEEDDVEAQIDEELEHAADALDNSHKVNPTEATTEIAGEVDDGRQYWLMKAEPQTRIEMTVSGKEVDVRFSIDDLRAKTEPEPWEGIRNLVAQKNMRNMKVGDLAFFYESNTKQPGIVGIMEIVQESSPDQTAFSDESPYYDPKSDRSKPKWHLVHVEHRRKFAQKITLKDLQKFKDAELASMDLIRQGRLSVGKVSPAEWKFIMAMAGDDDESSDEEERGADFASAFEAPGTLDGVNEADASISSTSSSSSSSSSSADIAEELSNDLGIVRDAIPDPVLPSDPIASGLNLLESPLPTIEGILPDVDTFMPNETTTAGGIFETLKSVVGLGTTPSRADSRARSTKPSSRPASRATSRAGSAKPSSRPTSRAGSLRPSSRAGSAVPAPSGSTIGLSPARTTRGGSKPPRSSFGDFPEPIVEEDDLIEDNSSYILEEDPTADELLARPLTYA